MPTRKNSRGSEEKRESIEFCQLRHGFLAFPSCVSAGQFPGGGNRLSSLPESVGNLKNLTHLYVYSNQLAALPESTGDLTQLHTLDLSYNELTALPELLGNLANLDFLYVSHAHLTALPASLKN